MENKPNDPYFQVTLSGNLTGEFDKATVLLNLQKEFHVSAAQVGKMLGKNGHVVKKDVSEEAAVAMLVRLTEAGCEAFFEKIMAVDSVPFDEKRSSGERRQMQRRKARPRELDRRVQLRRSAAA